MCQQSVQPDEEITVRYPTDAQEGSCLVVSFPIIKKGTFQQMMGQQKALDATLEEIAATGRFGPKTPAWKCYYSYDHAQPLIVIPMKETRFTSLGQAAVQLSELVRGIFTRDHRRPDEVRVKIQASTTKSIEYLKRLE